MSSREDGLNCVARLCSAALATVAMCFCQTNVGRISGTVFDSSSAAVPACRVEAVNAGTGIRYFKVKVLIKDPDGRLRPGMTAQVDIIVDAKKGYILTNNHVIDGARQVMVTLFDVEKSVVWVRDKPRVFQFRVELT